MLLKIWLCCVFFNVFYITAKEEVFDKKYGLKLKDLISIFLLAITPLGTIVFLLCLWDDAKDAYPKIMNYYVVKPEKPKPKQAVSKFKYITINDVASGQDKTPTSLP